MDLQFSKADDDFRDEVRTWLRENIPAEPRPEGGAALRRYDCAWQQTQYQGGWAGISWPREYGGCGLSLTRQLIWHEEYASAKAPPAGLFFIGLNHAGPTLIARGNDEQKGCFLPAILRGETPWCQGFSEPSSGSDLASLKTRATIDGDHLVVNGSKIWTSGAEHAVYQELLVRTDPGSERHRGLTWIIGDMRQDGVSVHPIATMDGHEHFCQVFYDDVRIPLSHVVGEVDGGWSVAMATLGFERGTAALADQIEMSRIVEELITLARTLPAPRGGGSLLDEAAIGAALADLRAEVAALRSLSYVSISRARTQEVPGPEGAMVGLFSTELMQRIYVTAMDILGAAGLERDERTRRWITSHLTSFRKTIGGGTSEIRRNIIGERVLGLPR